MTLAVEASLNNKKKSSKGIWLLIPAEGQRFLVMQAVVSASAQKLWETLDWIIRQRVILRRTEFCFSYNPSCSGVRGQLF